MLKIQFEVLSPLLFNIVLILDFFFQMANQIDMNAQSELMASFEETL